MAFLANFEVSQSFLVNAGIDEAYSFLCDVPKNLALHPNTSEVRYIEPDVYEVMLKKIGTDKYNFQPSYTCRYVSSADTFSLNWNPVNQKDSLCVVGFLSLSEAKSSEFKTQINMRVSSEMNVQLPNILSGAVTRFVAAENLKASRVYANNIISFFGGGALLASSSS